jgi:hypothetical protein
MGHFTQLVWKGTETVGCGRSNCSGRGDAPGWYVVCEVRFTHIVLLSGVVKEEIQDG